MKPWIKIAIGVLAGFAGGFASGFLFHKKLNDVEFEEISNEEMASYETKEEKKDISRADIKSLSDLPEDPDKIRLTLQGKTSYVKADQEAKEKYANIWNAYKRYSNSENADELPLEKEDPSDIPDIEEGFDEEFLEVIEKEQVEPGQVAPPYPISLGEFYNERSEYDKVTIDWYEPDTFVDENEEIIADLKTYVGNIDILKLFESSGEDEDPDIRFIRNEQYGTDYEIIRHHRTWLETVGGSE